MYTNFILSDDVAVKLMPSVPEDVHFMQLAITLAQKGKYTARPNPCVGCVLVQDGQVIGSGFHPKAGQPHAEIFALRDAQAHNHAVAGATAYVTLEPCSHFGRTPPCALALIEAGVARVVIAGLDPNPKVAGKGVALLLQAGILVSVGVLVEQAQALNRGFLQAMQIQMPFVRLKMGVSLDGRIAMASGESRWITDSVSRHDVQKLRAMSGAIVTGANTIMMDNPALTVRDMVDDVPANTIPSPKIVVVDRRGAINPNDNYQVLQNPQTMLWRADLPSLLQTLVAQYQCYDVLVEAGATLASAFLQQDLVDELIIYQAPRLLGIHSQPMFVGSFSYLKDTLNFRLQEAVQLQNDVRLTLVRA